MKVYVATDHAGFHLKEKLVPYLRDLGYEVVDMGAHSHEALDDYPDFVAPVAKAVSQGPVNRRGIVLGASGQGEAIVANRFRGVRAAVYYGGNTEIVTRSREHNDANVLSLGAMFLSEDEAKRAVHAWLETDFYGEERHVRRIRKIDGE